MKIGKLLRYSLYLFIMILTLYFILTIYLYFFSSKPSMEIIYSFLVPICIFVVSLFYSKKIHEKGLLRGIELWIVYFAFVLIMKVLFNLTQEINIVQNLIYLPISILGGILGVNMKQRIIQK